jgi:RNA polymerase sigma-70 factor (ECF subfamily)
MNSEFETETARHEGGIDGSNRVAEFERHRRLLFSIAYRMLASVDDAEDMLQEAFIRWQQASETEIRSSRAFLVTVVSRLCINHLQSARVRREEYVGEWLPEPLVTETGNLQSRIVQVDESVSMALLLLLERLTPVERAVFLLREVFDYTHAEIADVLELTEANCRQLLRRAREHVRLRRPRFKASAKEHGEVLERFHAAARNGDMDKLLALLSRDVVLHSDGGGKAPALPLPVHGPDKVARTIVNGLRALSSLKPVQRIVEVNGEPGIVSYVNGLPQSVFTLQVTNGHIEAIFIITNPGKLSHLPPPTIERD